jgi:hypothetical protein
MPVKIAIAKIQFQEGQEIILDNICTVQLSPDL